MKNNRHRTLPYPLLSPLSTDISPNTFTFNCPQGNIVADRDAWIISGTICHDSHDLKTHVNAGNAIYGLHVECSRTFYRAWFPQNSPEMRVNLPANQIRGKVELLAMCVATRELPAYSITGQHADYGNATFPVAVGDVLAVAPEIEFDAYIDLDPIRKISSILDIQRSKEQRTGPAQIDFNDNHILVELSEEDFQHYVELRADPTVRGLLSANVVFPAILQAVAHLGRLSPEELRDAKDNRRWCRCLIARLEQENIEPNAEPEEMFPVVQKILKEPVRHGIDDLLQQFNGGGA